MAERKESWSGGAASDLWRNTLSQITSAFGRLIYLASLRNSDTGQYQHHGLALVFGEKDADRALRKSHQQNLQDWLMLPLERQTAEVAEYLEAFGEKRVVVLETWLRLKPYRNILPTSAKTPERSLFTSNLLIALEILSREYGVDARDPDA